MCKFFYEKLKNSKKLHKKVQNINLLQKTLKSKCNLLIVMYTCANACSKIKNGVFD